MSNFSRSEVCVFWFKPLTTNYGFEVSYGPEKGPALPERQNMTYGPISIFCATNLQPRTKYKFTVKQYCIKNPSQLSLGETVSGDTGGK